MFKRLFVALLFLSSYAAAQPKINASKDYLNERPFVSSLHGGAWSIEVDVVAKDGVLYLADSPTSIVKEKTFQDLYIETASRLGQRKKSQMFVLLVNIKDDFNAVYPLLNTMVKKHATAFEYKLQVVLTGAIPEPKTWSKYPSYIAFEGVVDLEYDKKSLEKVVMLTADYAALTNGNTNGELSEQQKGSIEAAVKKASAYGKPLRLLNTPDVESAWKLQISLGVEVINTQNLSTLVNYLKG